METFEKAKISPLSFYNVGLSLTVCCPIITVWTDIVLGGGGTDFYNPGLKKLVDFLNFQTLSPSPL